MDGDNKIILDSILVAVELVEGAPREYQFESLGAFKVACSDNLTCIGLRKMTLQEVCDKINMYRREIKEIEAGIEKFETGEVDADGAVIYVRNKERRGIIKSRHDDLVRRIEQLVKEREIEERK